MIDGQLTRLRPVAQRDIDDHLAGDETSLSLLMETLDGTPVGRLDVEEIDPRHRSARVVPLFGEPDLAAQGRDGDAIAAVCRYLFDKRGLHRIGLTVVSDDRRVLDVCEQLGFRREGMLRDAVLVGGTLRDEIVLSLLAGELRD